MKADEIPGSLDETRFLINWPGQFFSPFTVSNGQLIENRDKCVLRNILCNYFIS
jgi:hypothetical protein